MLRHEVRLTQQARVPVGSPALVHDLGREHGIEIEGLFPDREKDIALPALHFGRVVRNEPQKITLRVRWDRRPLLQFHARGSRRRVEGGKTLSERIVYQRL